MIEARTEPSALVATGIAGLDDVLAGGDSADERFLLVAPTGRDAPLTCALFARAGLTSIACKDIEDLCSRCKSEGAAGLVIAEEVLVPSAFRRLRDMLAAQESWSDLPILLFTATGSSLASRDPSTEILAPLGNVTLLERPVLPITLLSAANSALRGRRRQYAARAELLDQQRAVRQRDQFLAMLGHELRNPLAAIALAHSLESSGPTSVQHEIIGRQVQHLTRLVDDLLDVARVTTGKIMLKCESVDLSQLAETCFAALEPVVQLQQLELRFIKPARPLIVHADLVRLEQVIVNLLTNAAKYTPPSGKIELSLRADENQAVLEVQDTGVGIAADMVDSVFDLFAQAEGSLDRAKGGLGIGLTLVRNVVEQHGGTVQALSLGLGRGSTFRVRLPLTGQPAPALPVERVTQPELAQPIAGCDVLVVEDNADSRELLTQVLERLGHSVHAADDGPSGVQLAVEKKPDVILVDIGLPGLDGYGVAKQVRQALGHGVYLIALTGYGQPEDRRRALEAGFDAHFTKPVDLRAINELIKQPKLRSAVF